MDAPMDTEQAYAHCQGIAKRRARNFYYAFRTLPAHKRRAIYAVYAFCRICDDIADGDAPLDAKRSQLAAVRLRLLSAPAPQTDGPIFAALRHAVSAFSIPPARLEEVIDGVEMDLTKNRFADWEELSDYCRKVASAVGLICVEIFGYRDARARQCAADMGIAMQLTNIMRDVKEDADRDRIYLPADEMRRFGYTESELKAGAVNDAFRALMAHQAARARQRFDSGRNLFALVSPDAAACPKLMLATYSGLLDRIERAGFDVYQRRISLTALEKALLLARLWAQSLIPSRAAASARK